MVPDSVISSRYLEEDDAVSVVARRKVLRGYELYLVEQWACSRQSPTLVIVTYTGDTSHRVVVGVLGIPSKEEDWSPRLKVYFKAGQQFHARPKDTPLGELMVTNLSSFPSALTVIPVPDGDIRKNRQAFIVNEDLKRLGCAGRSGLTLSEPTKATQDKFMSLYKTSDRVPFSESVLELVKLCQIALFIFGLLDKQYIDGLLCDLTEKAINDWWTEIGSEVFTIEPADGILGPTTVAAMLGTLMGARSRLNSAQPGVGKDVFDADSMKRSIGYFQKGNKLERTRRLDHKTLRKLHSVTAKAAAGDGGWRVQKAVKSTVEGFGGKRGELLTGMVGGKDKANIGDIETLDLDRFISLSFGEHAKWLWYGKQRRSATDHHERSVAEIGNTLFGKEDAAVTLSRRTQSLPLDEEVEARKKEEPTAVYAGPAPGSALSVPEGPGDKDAARRTVFQSVAGRVSDARSGFGRIRDAVGGGLRGHASRPSRDDTPGTGGYTSPSIASLAQSSATLSSPGIAPAQRAFTWKNKPEEYANAFRKEHETESAPASVKGMRTSDTPPKEPRSITKILEESQEYRPFPPPEEFSLSTKAGEIRRELVTSDASVAGSVVDETDLQGPFLAAERSAQLTLSGLQRRHSIEVSRISLRRDLDDARWPRRLSFSATEEAILVWDDVITLDENSEDEEENETAGSKVELARSLYQSMALLRQDVSPWVAEKVASLEALDDSYGRQQDDLHTLYYQLSEAFTHARQGGQEAVAAEQARAAEAARDVEVLQQKLEYEIGALIGRVREVEDGARQFELQVEDVEARADELQVQLETESWPHWFVRTLTGIGTGANITGGVRRRKSRR
jgi:hypothetical protein